MKLMVDEEKTFTLEIGRAERGRSVSRLINKWDFNYILRSIKKVVTSKQLVFNSLFASCVRLGKL